LGPGKWPISVTSAYFSTLHCISAYFFALRCGVHFRFCDFLVAFDSATFGWKTETPTASTSTNADRFDVSTHGTPRVQAAPAKRVQNENAKGEIGQRSFVLRGAHQD
jgi:hypothetical protein